MKWWRVVLLNRILHPILGVSVWRFPNGWIAMRDSRRSRTLELVYREIMRGDYTLPIHLMPGDTVIDFGAHVGMWTIPLAKSLPFVRFICIEPDHANYLNLVSNVRGLGNVQVFNFAVGPIGAVNTARLDPRNTGGNRTEWNHLGAIPCAPIRFWVNWFQPRLVKLDVEGAEFKDFNPLTDLHGVESVVGELHEFAGDAHQLLGEIDAIVPRTHLTIHE